LAESICKAAPLAVRVTKEAMMRGLDMSLEEGLRLEDESTRYIMSTRDFEEGINAFHDKRNPKYEGK